MHAAKIRKVCDFFISSGIIFLIVFTPLAFGTVQPWSIMVMELVAVFIAMLWVSKMLAQGKLTFVRTPLNIPLLLFTGYILLQLAFSNITQLTTHHTLPVSVYPHATRTELLKFLSYILVFLVFINNIHSRKQLHRFLIVIVSMGFVLSVLGIIMLVGGADKIFWFKKVPAGATSFFSSYVCRNHFAGYIEMIIPLTLGLLFAFPYRYGYQSSNKQFTYSFLNSPSLLLLFTAVIMASALFLSLSRAGMTCFSGSLLFMGILLTRKKSTKKKTWLIPVVILFVFVMLLWMGMDAIAARISLLSKLRSAPLSFSRLQIWKDTLHLIKDHPLWGTGFGTFAFIFPTYKSAAVQKFFSHAHNDYLQLIAETGIVGFLILVWAMVVFFMNTVKNLLVRHDPYVIGITIGGLASILALTLHSFMDFNLHISANALLFFMIMGISTVVVHSSLHREEEQILLSTRTFRIKRKAQFCCYSSVSVVFAIMCVIIIRPALAESHFRKGEFSKAIRFDSGNAKYHYSLAKQHSRNAINSTNPINALNLALAEYETAVHLNPTNSKYHQSLAWTYVQLSDISPPSSEDFARLAHEHFETAIRLEPNNPYRHRAYAIWLLNHPTKENIERGIAEYKKAIDLKPGLAKEIK